MYTDSEEMFRKLFKHNVNNRKHVYEHLNIINAVGKLFTVFFKNSEHFPSIDIRSDFRMN